MLDNIYVNKQTLSTMFNKIIKESITIILFGFTFAVFVIMTCAIYDMWLQCEYDSKWII